MKTRHLMCVLGAGLAFGTACQRSQRGYGDPGASGGEAACARQPGEPPAVGEGASQTVQRPCAPAGTQNGEVSKRPDEL